jgi:hypothetical protein
MNATLDKLMNGAVRRCGDSLLASPDADAEAQEDSLHADPAAAEYIAWLTARGVSLARPGSKTRLLKELLEEAERRESQARKELEAARQAQARDGGTGRSGGFAARLEAELEDIDAITRRILPLVRPAFVRGQRRPETIRCRYYRSCRGKLRTSREAWEHGSVCESCRESAVARRAGSDEGGTWLDELVSP